MYNFVLTFKTTLFWDSRSQVSQFLSLRHFDTIPECSFISERELMFMFAICRRPSVCLSVVCNVRAPYSGDWNFRQYFYIIRKTIYRSCL